MKKTGKKFFRDLLVKIGGGLFVVSAALVVPGAVADDEVKVTVAGTVDSSRVAVGEPFELRIQIRSEAATMSGVGNPRLPDLDGFRVEGSPSRSMQTQISIINGQITPLVTQEFTFTLIPERQGSIVIGAAEILVDEKKYSTQPIRMQVGPAGSAPRSRGAQQRGRPGRPGGADPFLDPDDMLDQMLRRHGLGGGGGMDDDGPALNEREAFFIRLVVDKDEVYVGEQITASWYLYTRNEVRNIDSLKYPDLKGFWKEDIDRATGLVFEDDVVNGVRFRRAPLMSFALFPLKEGTAIIDPYKVKCTVVQGSAFGFGRPFTFTKISPEKKIRVLPIPAGSPREFTGAVGDFEIRSSVASTKIVVGQPFSVKVKVEGRGNAKMIEFPPWELPKSLEQFEVKSDSKFFRTGESYKEFEVLLIPRVAGPVTLPELGFSAFDPKTRSFVRKVAPAIAINVVTGAGGDNFQNQRMAENKGSAEKTAEVLPQAVMSFESPFYFRHAFWNILILAMGLVLVGVFVFNVRDLRGKPGIQRWEKQTDVKLKKLSAHADRGDYRKFAAESLNLVYFLLGGLVNDKGAHREWRELITQFPVSFREKLEPELKPIMDDLETLAFAPEQALAGRSDTGALKKVAASVKKISRMVLDQMKET